MNCEFPTLSPWKTCLSSAAASPAAFPWVLLRLHSAQILMSLCQVLTDFGVPGIPQPDDVLYLPNVCVS